MEKVYKIVAFIGLAVLAYLTLFDYLGAKPLNLWDEARLANNAFEMLQHGNWFVKYFNYEPDMWSTKPPLMPWAQALSMKLFGFNVLAVRLPAAVAGLSLIIFLLIYSYRVLGSVWIGYFASVILLSTSAFAGFHVARSGDHDSFLVLFSTIMVLCFYAYIKSGRFKFLYYTCIALTLGILTKGIAVFFFTPAMFAWLLYSGKFKTTVNSKHFYYAISIVVFFGLGFYFLRESLNPGYMQAVYNNELGGRYGEVLEGHRAGPWFYAQNFIYERYTYWLPLLIIALVALIGWDKKLTNNSTLPIYLFTLSVWLIFIISTASTKIFWYDAPIYPLLALIIGRFIYAVGVKTLKQITPLKFSIAAFLLIGLIWFPVNAQVESNRKVEHYTNKEVSYGNYRKHIADETNYSAVYIKYNSHIDFFVKVDNLLHPEKELKSKKVMDIRVGEKVVVCEPYAFQAIEEKFNFKLLDEFKSCRLLEIVSLK